MTYRWLGTKVCFTIGQYEREKERKRERERERERENNTKMV